MDTKLTIRLNEKIIQRAKKYAKHNKISLSKVIESYLDSLTRKTTEKDEITPFVENLIGVVELPLNYDYKNDFSEYLQEKYK